EGTLERGEGRGGARAHGGGPKPDGKQPPAGRGRTRHKPHDTLQENAPLRDDGPASKLTVLGESAGCKWGPVRQECGEARPAFLANRATKHPPNGFEY